MSSFNKRYGHAVTRISFWHAMTVKLAEFDSLVHRRESLMPEDVQTLRQIHEALYECYISSKGRKEYHEASLERLRKEHKHGSEITNQ